MKNNLSKKTKVAIGPVFDKFGGVSRHIFSIQKFSRNKISILPSNLTRNILSATNYADHLPLLTLKDIYQDFMKRVKLNGYDVVHSHAHSWFTRLCQSSRSESTGWMHTYHTLHHFAEDYAGGLTEEQVEINRILIDVAINADVRISVSNWLKDYLLEKYSIQTIHIPNGVDIEKCDKASRERFYHQYGLRDFILFVGNAYPIKNPDFFIKLSEKIPEVKFVMIGKDLDLSHFVYVNGSRIQNNLYLLGELSHNQTLDAIASCKILAMTSKREGLPTTLLEAMALSKPVVVPAHTGCKEVVGSSDCGFLYAPNSINDLLEKTQSALTSEGTGAKARERVLSKYDWRILAPRIDDIYESLM